MGGYFFYYFYFCSFSVSLRLLASGNLRRKKWMKGWWFQGTGLAHPSSFHCAAVQSWQFAFCVCLLAITVASRFSSERTVFGFWFWGWGLSWKRWNYHCSWLENATEASVRGCGGRQWRALRSGLLPTLVCRNEGICGVRFWKQSGSGEASLEKHLASRGLREAGCGKSLGRMETERA